jgi:hypothetical protein
MLALSDETLARLCIGASRLPAARRKTVLRRFASAADHRPQMPVLAAQARGLDEDRDPLFDPPPTMHRSLRRPNARSRTCWSQCGEHNRTAPESPSHGENRGSSPLGSAKYFKYLAQLSLAQPALSPTFLQWTVLSKLVRGHPVIVRSRRPKIGAVTAEPASVLTYKDDKDDPRSHRGALRGAN